MKLIQGFVKLFKATTKHYTRLVNPKQRDHIAKVFHTLAMLPILPLAGHYLLHNALPVNIEMWKLAVYGIIFETLAIIALIAGDEDK